MRSGQRVAVVAVVVALVAAAAVFARAPRSHQLTSAYTFEQYVADFQKTYAPSEHAQRKKLFAEELARVLAHNAAGTESWRMGVNRFTDWTEEEKAMISKGARPASGGVAPELRPKRVMGSTGQPLPASVDWRTVNPAVLTAVKDQGQCGSCWAHGTTESLEAYWALATGDLFVLSQQQITSCTPDMYQGQVINGCGGNWPSVAFEYAAASGGVTEEWVYPYQSYQGVSPNCTTVQLPMTTWAGYNMVQANSPDAFAEALTSGPLSITVDASQWNSYESGIMNYTAQGLDHAVQAVGYGYDAVRGMAYWVVRNSWAASWGENGYIRLQREPVGQMQCGQVNLPSGKVGPACGSCGLYVQPLVPVPAL